MSAPRTPSETAFRVADRLRRRPGPWDVYAEVIRRFEVHLNGREFEMRRGPILLEGYGFREIQPADGGVRIGFAGSTDLSERGIERTADEASTAGRFASFPAKEVTLPASTGSSTSVETVDPELWDHPETSIDRFLSEILAPLEGRTDVRPSFGSLRVSLVEVTFTNSSGAEGRRRRTVAELEFAIRSTDGGEGRPPGEYWVNQQSVSLDHRTAAGKVLDWCRKAKDARNAKPTPSGASQVLLPIEVLSDFVPATLGFRLGGQAALRGMMPPKGTTVAGTNVRLWDDGLHPFGLASSPWDDEGVPHARRLLVRDGLFEQPLYDLLYARALGAQSSGAGHRGSAVLSPWFHFMAPPTPSPTTMVLEPGAGGTDAEMIEAVGDGLWLDQLGYAFPDAISSTFGGEVRLGYVVERGKLTNPVRGGTVGGVVLGGPGEASMLQSVRSIGSHPSLVGRLSAPTISVGSLTVAGA